MNKAESRIQELEEALLYARYGIIRLSKDDEVIPLDDGLFLIKSSGTLATIPKESPSCKLNGEPYEHYIYNDSKWYEKILRKIKKWLGISYLVLNSIESLVCQTDLNLVFYVSS